MASVEHAGNGGRREPIRNSSDLASRPLPALQGFVLAGGQSRRMGGQDKALLPFGAAGKTMLEHTADLIREVAGNAAVLGPASRYAYLNLPVVEDVAADCGPLGGIYSALLQGHERILVAPVDLPRLTVAFLRELTRREGRCVIAAGQPLCGVYHRDCLPLIEEAVRAGKLRVTAVASALGAIEVTPEDPQVLENRNTPADWQGKE